MAEAAAQSDEELLDRFQQSAFGYFLEQFNPDNGLVADTSRAGSPASIAVVGFARSCYPVGVERGWIARADAAKRTLVTLRFFSNSRQCEQADGTGYKGFYYHFLDMKTGKRVWQSELSLIDTTLLLAGVLTASVYFSEDTPSENEIRERAEAIYRRIDWQWACGGGYAARGVPYGPDDGTIGPCASLPFAPELALPALRHFCACYPDMIRDSRLPSGSNPTLAGGSPSGGLDQGVLVLMIENYRSGLIWKLMRRCPYIGDGLRRAGFTGGWLS